MIADPSLDAILNIAYFKSMAVTIRIIGGHDIGYQVQIGQELHNFSSSTALAEFLQAEAEKARGKI